MTPSAHYCMHIQPVENGFIVELEAWGGKNSYIASSLTDLLSLVERSFKNLPPSKEVGKWKEVK